MERKQSADVTRVFLRILCLVLGFAALMALGIQRGSAAVLRNAVLFQAETADVAAQSVVPTLSGKSFSLSFEDEILVNFYYAVSDTTDVAQHGVLVFHENPGTASYDAADEVYGESTYDPAKNYYLITTTGIAAKEMGDARYYAAYAKLTDGTTVYSKLYEYSPKKYATNMLGKDTTSAKQKALCVALLNYGAAAQSYFGYNTGSMMNAQLTDAQKALVIGYDKTLFTGAVAADKAKIGAFAATSTGFSKKSIAVSFEGAFCMNYYFAPSAAVTGDMTLYIWTPADYASAATLTAENASQIMTMVPGADGYYWGQVSGIAAKALDETYYVAGVYTGADGSTYSTGVIAYSLSKYCINKAVDGNAMQELASATAMYGYYAKAYFGGSPAPVITKPTLTVGTVNAAAGATGVEVTVQVVKNPGIAGMTLSAEYDDSVLTLTKVTTKTALSGLTFQKPKTYKNGCNLVWYGAEPNTVTDGEAFVLVFTVSATAKPGTYPIKLVYSSGYDASLGSIDMAVTGGSIVVTG